MRLKVFGMKAVIINNIPVYTYNILIKDTEENATICSKSGISYNRKAGKRSDRISLNYATLSITEFQINSMKLGKLLKNVAQGNLERKYSWTKEY